MSANSNSCKWIKVSMHAYITTKDALQWKSQECQKQCGIEGKIGQPTPIPNGRAAAQQPLSTKKGEEREEGKKEKVSIRRKRNASKECIYAWD